MKSAKLELWTKQIQFDWHIFLGETFFPRCEIWCAREHDFQVELSKERENTENRPEAIKTVKYEEHVGA